MPIQSDGTLRSFTIVAFAAPGIEVPFVAAVIDCGDTRVRANLINVDPRSRARALGMPVRLATYPIGTDSAGTEAIGFGFEPVTSRELRQSWHPMTCGSSGSR